MAGKWEPLPNVQAPAWRVVCARALLAAAEVPQHVEYALEALHEAAGRATRKVCRLAYRLDPHAGYRMSGEPVDPPVVASQLYRWATRTRAAVSADRNTSPPQCGEEG